MSSNAPSVNKFGSIFFILFLLSPIFSFFSSKYSRILLGSAARKYFVFSFMIYEARPFLIRFSRIRYIIEFATFDSSIIGPVVDGPNLSKARYTFASPSVSPASLIRITKFCSMGSLTIRAI